MYMSICLYVYMSICMYICIYVYMYMYILAKTRQYPLTEDRIGIRSKRANKIERNDQHIRSRTSIMKFDQHF